MTIDLNRLAFDFDQPVPDVQWGSSYAFAGLLKGDSEDPDAYGVYLVKNAEEEAGDVASRG